MNSSYRHAHPVTPNDGADNVLDEKTVPELNESRALFATVGGTLAWRDPDGKTSEITATAGTIYPIATRRVLSTGTSATGIIALW